jgi:hypothetical protein
VVSFLGSATATLNTDHGLVAKGKQTVPGVFRAAEQYGVTNQFLDCLVYDVTQSPLRRGGWIDAIITDPPCKWNGGEPRIIAEVGGGGGFAGRSADALS